MAETRVSASEADRNVRGERAPGVSRVRLTGVELEILVALSNGLQSKEIARDLRRSVATIEAYIRVLCGKLDARTRTHLVAQAFRAGLLPSE